jgi:hypothetical protein
MPLKQQEKFCRDEFNRWLKERYPNAQIAWEDESNDPPDFWLRLNGKRYAVEVTRILDEQERGDTASLWRVVKSAEREAQEAGELSGTYVVLFEGRIDNLGKVRNAMKASLREFVRQTVTLQDFSPTPIEINGRVLCRIQKLSSHRSVLAPVGGVDNSGSWEGEILKELGSLLERSLVEKSTIAAKVNVPIILILYDLYGLASRKAFIECLQKIPEAKVFHAVYVVEDIGQGYVAIESTSANESF